MKSPIKGVDNILSLKYVVVNGLALFKTHLVKTVLFVCLDLTASLL